MTPEKEAFSLKKLKRSKTGGLEVSYEVTETIGQEIYYNENTIKTGKEPHPDLTGKLRALGTYVGKIMKCDTTKIIVDGKSFNATDKQKDLAEKASASLAAKIRINGVSIRGRDGDMKVKILAVFEPDTMQALAINPQVIADADVYGFEDKVVEIVEAINDEAYAYLFEDKKAQMEMFTDD